MQPLPKTYIFISQKQIIQPVYLAPFSTTDRQEWAQFTHLYTNNQQTNNPKMSKYQWSAHEFIANPNNKDIDGFHTFMDKH